jgi:hypothetical protein
LRIGIEWVERGEKWDRMDGERGEVGYNVWGDGRIWIE